MPRTWAIFSGKLSSSSRAWARCSGERDVSRYRSLIRKGASFCFFCGSAWYAAVPWDKPAQGPWHPAALLPVLAGACVANVLGPCAALRQRTVGFYPSYRRNQGGKVFCPFPLPQIFHSILQKMYGSNTCFVTFVHCALSVFLVGVATR